MSVELERIDGHWLKRFRANLRRWYDKHARDLPWRRTRDAYAVWISEIMLQQTTVKAVIPYYSRFLKSFPTIQRLASATEEEVLNHWEGLGYYSRARNIHKTAKLVTDKFSGRFPESVDELQSLPGIGRYTAGAIASFAFDHRAPIVEANTLRLYSRLLGFRGDPRSSDGQRLLWQFAERLLPRNDPGRFNQALMELGSAVCTVNDPACSRCPGRTLCSAAADGIQNEIPRAPAKIEITEITEVYLAVKRRRRFLLYKRPTGQRWAGLWDFPRFEIGHELTHQLGNFSKPDASVVTKPVRRSLEQLLEQQTGITASVGQLLTQLNHGVTRYRIRLICFDASYKSGQWAGDSDQVQWVSASALSDFPLSTTGRKVATLLQNGTGADRDP